MSAYLLRQLSAVGSVGLTSQAVAADYVGNSIAQPKERVRTIWLLDLCD